MPKLRILSAKKVVKILSKFNFAMASQEGSHIKLSRPVKSGTKQVLIIPNHKELDKGTIQAIYRQATRYVTGEELYDHFYTS